MRVIAGEARGRTLAAPKGEETRPTSDKIREALFSIIRANVPGACVLDLFGGTGALALEAVSRGAGKAYLFDVSQDAAKAISRNIETVCGKSDKAVFRRLDYKKALESLTGTRFDLVFLDPPYRMLDAYTYAVNFLISNDMLNEGGLIVAERRASEQLELPDMAVITDTRTYRDTALDFIHRRSLNEGDVCGQL